MFVLCHLLEYALDGLCSHFDKIEVFEQFPIVLIKALEKVNAPEPGIDRN